MEPAPCGCEQWDDARTARADEAAALREQAGRNADRWRCPRAGCVPEPVGDVAEVVLRQVETLTGCDPHSLRTCPRHEANTPDVARALRIYRATQSGGVVWDDDPPAAIVAASDIVGGADAARLDREQKERENERGR